MALVRKRIPTFGREDRVSGIRVLLRGQTFFIRLVAFLLVASIFILIVTLTHKESAPIMDAKDSIARQ